MDALSVFIDEKIKKLEDEIKTINRKRDVLCVKLNRYKAVGRLHEEHPLWEFLKEIKEITTSLNKSIEDEKK